ncbi:MAG: hypothetical protein VYA62_00230 [Planctomycetota bacterium]|nr:hypothetical protein [Planctomycetota bacterium]
MDGPPTRLLLLLALATTTAGCTTPVRVERLEAELRDQQDQLATQAKTLESLQYERDALRHQRDELLRKANSIVRPEQADLLARVEHLAINTWLTGGRNTDRQPGDDELVVMIQPRDGDGEPVKLPGTLQIRLTDPAAPAASRELGTWDFTSGECRKRWLASMLSRGFLFKLPWQTPPTRKRLLLHARFDTTDGRRFDADALIQVTPPSDPPRPPVQTANDPSDGG